MAASAKFFKICLNEEDVPGATLKKKPVEAHSKAQLERWLHCRGQKVGGRKSELVARVNACLGSNYVRICPGVDQGKWYEAKKARLQVQNNSKTSTSTTSAPIFPIIGWKKFPSVSIPKMFCYGIIYKHIIETAVILDKPNDISDDEADAPSGVTKPLKRGRLCFTSGNVTKIYDYQSKFEYCVKSTIISSYDSKKCYTVMIMLDKNSAEVKDSACGCVANAMGRCSHVAALLFALDDYTLHFGYDPVASTSVLCKWNQGRKKKESSQVFQRKYNSKTDPMVKYTYTACKDKLVAEDVTNKLLYENEFTTKGGDKKTGWETLLTYSYSDYDLTPDRLLTLKDQISQLRTNLQFRQSQPFEVPDTVNQSDSEKWFSLRRILITASKCRDFVELKEDRYEKVLSEHMWFPRDISTKYTKYGIENETKAVTEYERVTGNSVKATGLWVNPKYVGLGASPDGIVHDRHLQVCGLLEVKCPYVLKNFKPNELEKLSRTQKSAFCCTLDQNNHLQLKTSHKYYYQVHMQMAVLELPWCDFIIWTPKGINVERIYFDEQFWAPAVEKLLKFHANYMCFEYFEHRLPRNLKLINRTNIA